MRNSDRFDGTKLFLFLGGDLVTIRRDQRPDIPWPGMLDVPGGGQEHGETPVQCVLRETEEEIGLSLSPADLVWKRFYTEPIRAWFFAAHLPKQRAQKVVLGNEGTEWLLMAPEVYIGHPEAVPHFRARLAFYLND
ncbi:MAG TPA: NUDIX hydrolase [Roseovarius sp.]|nr:NUDIX hydrolase [Roseovarius sp.]